MKTALKPKAAETTKTARTKGPAPSTSQKATPKTPANQHHRALAAVDAMLDEALSETFPASDPVALTQPSRQRRASLKKRTGRRAG